MNTADLHGSDYSAGLPLQPAATYAETPQAPGAADAGGRSLLPTATRAETRRAVVAVLAFRRSTALAAIGTIVGTAAIGLAGPTLLGRLVDAVSDGGSASAVTGPAFGLAVVAVVTGLLTALGRILVARVGEGTVADLRERVMERATELDIETVERAGRGDLVARLADDVRVISTAVTTVIPTLAQAAFTIVLTLVSLVLLDWRFAAAVLCAVPVQAHTLHWYLGRSRLIYEASRVADGARAQQLLETLGSAVTIRSLRLAPAQLTAVRARSDEALEYSMASARMATRFYGRLNLAEVIGMSGVLIVGFVLVRDGAATIGAATAAALYFHRLFGPINELLGEMDTAQSAAAGLARLVGVINLPPSSAETADAENPDAAAPTPGGRPVASAPGCAQPATTADNAPAARPGAPTTGTESSNAGPNDAGCSSPARHTGGPPTTEGGPGLPVLVDGVGFAYQAGHTVLEDVSLRIEPGETVALVGASGAGKSTLAKLVAGIHRPGAGRLLVGGRTHDELRDSPGSPTVVLVTQDVHTFAGPLTADLRLARRGATDDELVAALDLVGALGWVSALPDGLETVVGEGGHRLTATQAQQIALARVVLVDAPVVLLDEATADAGSAGARILEAAARRVLAGRTAIVVAHRLTQAVTADRVVVLERGRLVEAGTHDELLAAGGAYAGLWQAWSAGRAARPVPLSHFPESWREP